MIVKTPKFIDCIFPSLIWRKKNSQNKIWLTFDDGPCPKSTPFILKTLKDEKTKATFFLIGEKIIKYPRLYKKILDDGHAVGNHSYSHKNGWLSKNINYYKDVEKCQKLMPNNNLFRPPYGKISINQIKYLKTKYKIILWDVLSYDFSANLNSKKIQKNILKNTASGSIIVLHNNQKSYNNIHPILKETIVSLKQNGFLFSTTW